VNKSFLRFVEIDQKRNPDAPLLVSCSLPKEKGNGTGEKEMWISIGCGLFSNTKNFHHGATGNTRKTI
jgi:hypothetical protein